MSNVRGWSGVVPLLLLSAWAPVHADAVTEWHAITVSCVQGPPLPANRGGPAGLLDIALVQAAVHDAVQAIEGRYASYEYENKSLRGDGSPAAAAASAAYGVLKGLYGADDPCLVNVSDPNVVYAGDLGLKAGAEAASALLPLHRPTMVLPTDPFVGSTEPGQWRPTTGVTQGAGTFMAVTAPFAMKSPNQFRPPRPPRLRSWQYWRDYQEVKAIGSSVNAVRTSEQTDAARFWSVNFISQWNEAVRHVADERVPSIGDKARLLALVAFAAADSQVSVYDSKYVYNFWRPVTAIQQGDFDGNRWTQGDPGWTPFIQTPPYPDYSSGANCLAASITGVLRQFFHTDKVEMSIWSTSAGLTKNPRTYARLSDIEKEMVEVRIWQGIHFRTAEVVGRAQGSRIAHWTYSNYLRPLRRKQ
jgi:PAP2 superfamily